MSLHNERRIYEIDVIRGVAIMLMVFFHFCYDLSMFRYVQIDFFYDPVWVWFRNIIVTMFLIVVGMGLHLAYHEKIVFSKMAKRLIMIGISAFIVSLGTYMMFPMAWIYFGILHFIIVASIVGVLFVKIPKVALGLGCVILTYSALGYDLGELAEYARWLLPLPHATLDLVPFIPWFGVVLIGIFLQSQDIFQFMKLKKSPVKNTLNIMGKNALTIYMIHQPILYGAIWGYYTIEPDYIDPFVYEIINIIENI